MLQGFTNDNERKEVLKELQSYAHKHIRYNPDTYAWIDDNGDLCSDYVVRELVLSANYDFAAYILAQMSYSR